MQSTSRHVRIGPYWIFLLTLSLLLMAIGGVVTSKYGAGVASDSVKYLGVTQSILDGNGLFDHRDKPLLSWPPLYPIIIAGLSALTRLDVFPAAWYLNIFILGLNLFLSGVILYRVFSEKIVYAYMGVIFIFLSNPNLRIHSVISSDPLYLTMVFVLVLALDGYIAKRSVGSFIIILIVSALTPLLRYVGLAIGATAGLVTLIENRKAFRVLLRDGFILGLATVLPIAWWLVIHNVMTYGSLWGLETQIVDTSANLWMGLTKILHWFVPYLSFIMPVLLRPWIIFLVLIAVLAFLNRRNGEYVRAWLKELCSRPVYPVLLHALVYFTAVTVTAITADHRDLYSDRYYFILLVPVLIVLFVTFDKLILPHFRLSARQVQTGWIVLFALWSVYPLYTMNEYVRDARQEGEPSSVNLFNNRKYNEMDLIAETKQLREREPDAVVYSNYVDAVWFQTRKPVTLLPFVKENSAGGYGDWPGDKPGYIVWFEPNEYKHYISPTMIQEFADLELVYQGQGGKIYYVHSR
jgi:hypothetical protein